MKISLRILNHSFSDMFQINYAYYTLALIENLEMADINYHGHTYQLTSMYANELVIGDIKDFGSTKDKLIILKDINLTG